MPTGIASPCRATTARPASGRWRRRRSTTSSTDEAVAQQCYNGAFVRWERATSTTTIRLPQDLKSRVAAAAERAGTTPHGFILEAIAEKTDREERRADFLDAAEKRYAKIVASGKTIPWERMRAYLKARVAGKKAARPSARKLAR